jgi:hypothetical protein
MPQPRLPWRGNELQGEVQKPSLRLGLAYFANEPGTESPDLRVHLDLRATLRSAALHLENKLLRVLRALTPGRFGEL